MPQRGLTLATPNEIAAQGETREIPALSLRASFSPESIDVEKRTAELVFTTGARVRRGGFWTEPFDEELSLDPKHVRMGRLKSGQAPLLDTHSRYELRSQIGVIESASIDKDGGRVRVRFSKRADVEPIWQDVVDGIIRNVSVGYSVHKFERVQDGDASKNGVPLMRAVDWEPAEVSLVPIPADAGAGVRSAHPTLPLGETPRNLCTFITRSQEPTVMADPIKNDATVTQPATATPAPLDEAKIRAEAAAEERTRSAGIMAAVRAVKLDDKFGNDLIARSVKLEDARKLIIDELAKRDADVRTEQHVRIEGGEDLRRRGAREGMLNALLHRADPRNKLDDNGRQYRGMSLLDMARESLGIIGVETRGMPKMEVAALALGISTRSSMSTSDFPLILADVANKTLRKAYDESPATYLPISRRVTLPDFKKVKRHQLGEAPQLKKVLEGGEFTRGSIGEGKEEYALATYGRVVSFTRQALVNDDMDAFSRVISLFGRSARDLEGDLVWEQITSNPTMGDGVALFHSTHANLGTAGAISVTTIGEARKLMRKQKGLDGKQFINVMPKYLIVPAEKETLADQFISTAAFVAATNSEKNPFAGRLQVVAEPRLDANSTTAWYVAADPGQIDIIEYGYLEGEEGPVVETRIGFDVDGLEMKCREDFAAKVIDHRGLVKNAGA